MSAVLHRSSVLSLLRQCGPTAILGLVVAIWVDPIQSHSFWSRPHVSQEGDEAVAPFLADGDPAPAVVFIASHGRIFTARDHRRPRTVFACALRLHAFGMAVHQVSSGTQITRKAAARLTTATPQMRRADETFVSAVAATEPPRMPRQLLSATENGPSSEAESDELVSAWSGQATYFTAGMA